jgi:cell division protein ZapD
MPVYEHPLNEKIRLFLRLTHLMTRFNHHIDEPKPENCQAAVMVLLELYNLSSRLDVKSATLNILDWQAQAIQQSKYFEDTDKLRIENLIEKLAKKSKQLYSFNGQLGQHLKSHNFLNILKQRANIAGGINELDIPLLNYWLCSPEKNRVADLNEWAQPYTVAYEAIQLIMELIYESAETQEIVAESGFYQATLSADNEYQILSISLPDNATFYPEVSAGKQRFSIRFVDAESLESKGKQIFDNVKFDLTLYSF